MTVRLNPDGPYCVCGRLIVAGPYYAFANSEYDVVYIDPAHPRCLREFDWELDNSDMGIHHLSCEEES